MHPDSQLAQIILYGAGVLLLGTFGWMAKTVRELTIEMASWRVALFGMKGDNGMAGDLKQLRTDVEAIERRQYSRRAGDLT